MPKLKPLQPPDSLHLQAAEGWLELGNRLEADAELDRITAKLRTHPDVLTVRFKIYATGGRWDAYVDIAKAITKLAPDRLFGWTHLSVAFHRLNRTQDAWDSLFAVVDKFPGEISVPYNLACYACQLGHLGRALRLLAKAFQFADPKKLKLIALEEPDLEPLWEKIGEL